MKETDLRGLLGTILFSAFTVIALFFLLQPLVAESTETLVVNTHKIYINFGWIKVYGGVLLIAFVLMVIFMNKRQVWPLIIGLVLGSIPLLEQYRVPGVARVLNVFSQSATANIQTFIPHLTVFLGALVVLALLRITNRIFK
ncbi:MAG TPA: hypothetical protein GXX33_05055 [Firmicutes bacterium]|uniref:Uncharacterized protein n=1 Tax=Capillibacterium thermochitinicola TaxID=2699427 RepID=A0A8J6HSX0_9FIRM|nr:hypothetical protein [Capillibacterium thermochitinicola]MBA2133581.1 hypothetical protein [Capillibacterium thermochitinicola]HHW12354.1 hypothetical protein [Bacillota bacterium]